MRPRLFVLGLSVVVSFPAFAVAHCHIEQLRGAVGVFARPLD